MEEAKLTRKPHEEEAKRRLDEYLATRPNPDGKLSNEAIIQLMADYAASQHQEGYETGWSEGYNEGVEDGYGSGAGW